MSWNFIPVTSRPDNTIAFKQDINGEKKPLAIRFRYNTMGEYWFMDIMDAPTRKPLVSGLPLVRGEFPCADMLEQFAHLGIGKSALVKIADNLPADRPNIRNLGVEFTLVWGDDSPLEVGKIAMGSQI